MLVHHFEVHEKVGAEHLQLKVGALHIQTGFITHFFQQHIGQAARTKHLGGRQRIGQSFSALGQRHKAAAGSLRQALQERLNFVFQHARHEPLGAVNADLIQHKQGYGHRDAVFGVTWVMQIRGLAIGAAQSDHLGKRLGGDTHRLVAHQAFAGHQEWLGLVASRASAPQFLAVPTLQRFAAAHVLRQMLFVKRLDHGLVHQHVLAARFVFQLHHLRNQFFVGGHEGQGRLPLRLHQCFADKYLPRQHRVRFGKWHPPSAVHHQAIQGGSLKGHHVAVPRFPVRVQQLLFQQVRTHLLQPCGLNIRNATPKQAGGFHQLGTHQPLTGLFTQMHAWVAMELDAPRTKVNVFLVLLEADVAQQAAEHGQMQLLVAGGFVVHHPALLFHHRQQLAVHIAPFAPAADVDEVLPQQVVVLAVAEFVRCTRLLRFARNDTSTRSLQPIPQT